MQNLDLSHVIRELAKLRPVFRSESELRDGIRNLVKESVPGVKIELEFPLEERGRARGDMLIRKDGWTTAIELKYCTKAFQGEINGQEVELRNHGAQDIRSHDFLKDISRLERFVAAHHAVAGAAIMLTNDPTYWTGPKKRHHIYTEFVLQQGRIISGVLRWAPHAGKGSTKGRDEPIILNGSYQIDWITYSRLDTKFGDFRFLCVPIRRN